MSRRSPRKTRSKKTTAKKKHHILHDKFGVRIAHHKHSGRHMPWQYTSYTILFFLIVFVFMMMIFTGNAARAYDQSSQRTIALAGFSKGPPPENAAVITSPPNRAVYEDNIVLFEGTCEAGLYIEMYRNGVLAGGAICQEDGTFSVNITLVPGKNEIQAKIHDALWQYGPDSDILVVWYNVPIPDAPILLVYTKPIQDGMFVDSILDLEYVISGGDAPYAASVRWGDGSVDTVNVRQTDGGFTVSHKYKKAGQYVITINVTDERDSRALIQSVVVVHETGQDIPFVNRTCTDQSCLSVSGGLVDVLDWAWPALIVAALMTLSFWIGEKVAFNQKPARLRTS